MREFLANLRVTVEAGQKGKKKKAKKKPKKKKEKKGKKKKDPTEGRSMERCFSARLPSHPPANISVIQLAFSIYGELVVAGIIKPVPTTRLRHFQGTFKNADPAAAARPGDEDKPLTDPSLAAVRQLLMEQVCENSKAECCCNFNTRARWCCRCAQKTSLLRRRTRRRCCCSSRRSI